MTPETLIALRQSIDHHVQNRDNPREANIYGESCPLCKHFTEPYDITPACHLCPVMLKSGYESCWGTPWVYLKNAYLYMKRLDYGFHVVREFQLAEQGEIDFLISLLPDDLPEREIYNHPPYTLGTPSAK